MLEILDRELDQQTNLRRFPPILWIDEIHRQLWTQVAKYGHESALNNVLIQQDLRLHDQTETCYGSRS